VWFTIASGEKFHLKKLVLRMYWDEDNYVCLEATGYGHANHRSDSYFSVAYWYQTKPHAPFPALPPVDDRVPKLYPVGGPGNAAQ